MSKNVAGVLHNAMAYRHGAVQAEAASWIAQLDSDDFTDADRIALQEWASRSPRHLAELKKLGAMWHDIDLVLSQSIDERFQQRAGFIQLLSMALSMRPKAVYGVGAAMAIAACLLLFFTISIATRLLIPATYEATFSVAEGEQDLFALPDGSSAHLNTDSLVQMEFDDTQRIVRLLRGEAHFNVAHDEKRPFFVHANGYVVRAVGTAFVVRVSQEHTSVLVTEGIVEFIAPAMSSAIDDGDHNLVSVRAPATRLVAGQTASIEEGSLNAPPKVSVVSEDVIDRKLSWREGLLIFDGEPLAFVVEEISRYTSSQIIISDPQIRSLPIGGSFKAGEVDALLGALEASFGVSVKRLDGDLIYLSSIE